MLVTLGNALRLLSLAAAQNCQFDEKKCILVAVYLLSLQDFTFLSETLPLYENGDTCMKPFHPGLALISVTEGDDKPLKHPTTFNGADVAIVTKVDLGAAVEFDWETAYSNI